MIEFIKVTAKVPTGETREYMFMGDLDKLEDQRRLINFEKNCCDDAADYYAMIAPDCYTAEQWHNDTMAMWEAMSTSRESFDLMGGYPFDC